MKLLTILGTGKYNITHYTWQDQKYKTPYVAEALNHFFCPKEIKIFVTAEAKQAHWDQFQKRLEDKVIITDILIPSGKTESEIWQIFDAVVDSVDVNSQVIFDITHAFRSIPLLVLLAAAFLKQARNVTIEGVYYGAFEVDRENPPIFNLTPALKLLDWLTATDKFINTGSSVELGNLLTTIQKDFYTDKRKESFHIRPIQLRKFGDRIQSISQAIDFVRPVDLMEEANLLKQIPIEQLQKEVGTFAKPFELILSQIQEDYGQFCLSESDNSKEQLQKQFLLLRWYTAKKLGYKAILLGREWVVSALCIADNTNDYRNKENRRIIEDQLGQMIGKEANLDQKISTYVKDVKKLASFWSKITQYRNDIAHVQMKKDPINATNLQNFADNQLLQSLEELFSQFVL
jgi:CRISPR-associated DxTHG motif protein